MTTSQDKLLASGSFPSLHSRYSRRTPTSYVSLTGTTGAKINNVGDIQHNIGKLRKVSAAPVAFGFGVATPEDASRVSNMADGVIVGSAIIKRIASHQHDPAMIRHVAEFVRSLKTAMAVG